MVFVLFCHFLFCVFVLPLSSPFLIMLFGNLFIFTKVVYLFYSFFINSWFIFIDSWFSLIYFYLFCMCSSLVFIFIGIYIWYKLYFEHCFHNSQEILMYRNFIIFKKVYNFDFYFPFDSNLQLSLNITLKFFSRYKGLFVYDFVLLHVVWEFCLYSVYSLEF